MKQEVLRCAQDDGLIVVILSAAKYLFFTFSGPVILSAAKYLFAIG